MSVTTASIISALKIVVIFTVLIGGAYGIVIPLAFPDYKTYSILIIGIAVAALMGGYIGYQIPASNTLLVKIGFGFCYAAVVAILVLLLSLLIILNVRGS